MHLKTFAAAALALLLASGPADAGPIKDPGLTPADLDGLEQQLDEILNTPGENAARVRAMRILAMDKAKKPVPREHVAAATAYLLVDAKIHCPNGSKDPADHRQLKELTAYLMTIPLPSARHGTHP